jgi:hypothetical protein
MQTITTHTHTHSYKHTYANLATMSTSEGLDTRHIWNYLCLAYDDWPISPLAHA